MSQSAEYALRATLYISRQSPRAVRIREVAEAVNAPRPYLAKILGQLARAGVLDSTRGPSGGFAFDQRRRATTLADVVELFDAREQRRCLLGDGRCGARPDCPVHGRWGPVAERMNEFFATTTIADLLPQSVVSTPDP